MTFFNKISEKDITERIDYAIRSHFWEQTHLRITIQVVNRIAGSIWNPVSKPWRGTSIRIMTIIE